MANPGPRPANQQQPPGSLEGMPMPTIARIGPHRVFFYGNEGAERPHVHVQRERMMAKFWLDPVTLASVGPVSTA